MDTPRWGAALTHRTLTRTDLSELRGLQVAAQEEERRRVSRELHDELGQRLALLEIQIEQMERQLGGDAAVTAALESLRGRVGEIADDLHRICCRLHPAVLENLGLIVAVRSYCEEYSAWSGVETRFTHLDVPSKLPPSVSLCIYRVVQETLRNVARHARATRVFVSIRGSQSGIQVTVKDNGCGFLVGQSGRAGGLGLISLTERVKLLGGTCHIRSAPHRGTRIHVFIPVRLPEAVPEAMAG
jgi:signal transduction histidine kinase